MEKGDLQTLTLHSVVKNVLPVMIDFNFLTLLKLHNKRY